jgi:energy-coupling factor transporter ATP-binding protein EcfA2
VLLWSLDVGAWCFGGNAMNNYVELSNLAKVYPTPKGEAVIVKDFNLKIQKGEFVTLIAIPAAANQRCFRCSRD